eukprot:SAG11_NODE_15136_length_588_cov_0.676892_1_plen_37_part_10
MELAANQDYAHAEVNLRPEARVERKLRYQDKKRLAKA